VYVEIEPNGSGLDEVSYARCEDVESVSIERLVRSFGTVSPETLHWLDTVLRYVLQQ